MHRNLHVRQAGNPLRTGQLPYSMHLSTSIGTYIFSLHVLQPPPANQFPPTLHHSFAWNTAVSARRRYYCTSELHSAYCAAFSIVISTFMGVGRKFQLREVDSCGFHSRKQEACASSQYACIITVHRFTNSPYAYDLKTPKRNCMTDTGHWMNVRRSRSHHTNMMAAVRPAPCSK